MSEKLLTAPQVADYLQLKVGTIYKWARNGEIPAVKVVRTWRFRPEDVERWLRKHTQEEKGGYDAR